MSSIVGCAVLRRFAAAGLRFALFICITEAQFLPIGNGFAPSVIEMHFITRYGHGMRQPVQGRIRCKKMF